MDDHSGERVTASPIATRSEVIAANGMAATSQPLATQVALDILQAGGSAVDAAIAANALLCLVEPTGCGLGGDLFAILWDPQGKQLHGLNASGRSPASLTREEFARRGLTRIPATGPLPVSVPGCVDGWSELHRRFGKLPLAQVLAPAIRYAREGAPISEVIAYYWARNARSLKEFPGFAEVFMPGGQAPVKGQRFKNPALANTLAAIAEGGAEAFYRGEIAETIAAYMADQGGFLTTADLAEHRSTWVAPVSANYRGFDVWELPPNGQGIAALQILNVLEGFDIKAMGFGSAEYIHVFAEAKKLAFEDRALLYADPDFADIPVAHLISKEYAAQRRQLIDLKRAAQRYPACALPIDEGDTIYLTTADKNGMMVSLIQSNYRGMGSGMTPPGLGFILQDRGELFDLTGASLNSYEPGKRPFHTIIPAFVTKDGQPYVSFGVMGGATQPQAHAQVIVNMIDFGMNLQVAGDAARVLHTGSSQPTGERMEDGGFLSMEAGIGQETRAALEKLGHRIGQTPGAFGGYQAIRWDADQGVYYGASESRKDGQAAGY
ncbi:MAG: gamma-glutamyltransferase [Planctomycetota bacterium]|nr:gamma-glutamyltransferase [Planctomycetota bacterium]MDP6956067.1 gamma-glutamyltransferase [Planctomycetota bacterium]